MEDTMVEDRSYLFRDYGTWRRNVPLFEAYLQAQAVADDRLEEAGVSLVEAARSDDEDLREAATTSDFATYLSDKATKRVMWSYNEVSAGWRRYARTYSVPDFKPISFVRTSEMQDLLPVNEGDPYRDSQISEIVGPSLTVGTFGRTFALSRRAIINDDLNQLRDRPAAMGRAAARTLSKDAVAPLVSNPNAYDGTALFHANHGNLQSLALRERALQRDDEDPRPDRSERQQDRPAGADARHPAGAGDDRATHPPVDCDPTAGGGHDDRPGHPDGRPRRNEPAGEPGGLHR